MKKQNRAVFFSVVSSFITAPLIFKHIPLSVDLCCYSNMLTAFIVMTATFSLSASSPYPTFFSFSRGMPTFQVYIGYPKLCVCHSDVYSWMQTAKSNLSERNR